MLRLSKTTSKALLMLSLELDVAPFTVILTVFSILLHKYTREVRTVSPRRPHPRARSTAPPAHAGLQTRTNARTGGRRRRLVQPQLQPPHSASSTAPSAGDLP